MEAVATPAGFGYVKLNEHAEGNAGAPTFVRE